MALAQAARRWRKICAPSPAWAISHQALAFTRAEGRHPPGLCLRGRSWRDQRRRSRNAAHATLGDYETALPKLNLSQRQVPIVVKLATDARQDLTYWAA